MGTPTAAQCLDKSLKLLSQENAPVEELTAVLVSWNQFAIKNLKDLHVDANDPMIKMAGDRIQVLKSSKKKPEGAELTTELIQNVKDAMQMMVVNQEHIDYLKTSL